MAFTCSNHSTQSLESDCKFVVASGQVFNVGLPGGLLVGLFGAALKAGSRARIKSARGAMRSEDEPTLDSKVRAMNATPRSVARREKNSRTVPSDRDEPDNGNAN